MEKGAIAAQSILERTLANHFPEKDTRFRDMEMVQINAMSPRVILLLLSPQIYVFFPCQWLMNMIFKISFIHPHASHAPL
ncbi:MAG: hypothetical protein VR64_00685 [Desulfatitalea sp. BRH_c12]|nr:MAG: hypothetical protein VR64_00685 [Desulfatitalea sp. BRH_c12]